MNCSETLQQSRAAAGLAAGLPMLGDRVVVTAMGYWLRSPFLHRLVLAKRMHGEFCEPFIWLSAGLEGL